MTINTTAECQSEVIDVIMNTDYIDVSRVIDNCNVELTGQDSCRLLEQLEDMGFKDCLIK